MKKIIIGFGVSFFLLASLILASCSGSETKIEEQGQKEEQVEKRLEKEDEKVFVTLSLGERFESPDVAVTVSDVLTTRSYEYNDESSGSTLTKEAGEGMLFLLARAKVENVGETQLPQEGYRRFHVFDSEGSVYMWTTYYGSDRMRKTYVLPKGKTIEGMMSFEISEAARGLKIAYMDLSYPPEPKKIAEWGF